MTKNDNMLQPAACFFICSVMRDLCSLPVLTITLGLIALGCGSSHPRKTPHTQPHNSPPSTTKLSEFRSLHNLHQLADDFYSGAEPIGKDAYKELASIGIKTVISVDGVAPNKALAETHGIRVVHLPIGYDGIDDSRSIELAHAIATLPKPIFVNCHHGKHRGPAALCVGAIGAGNITHEQAVAYMRLAQTSTKYHGLWDAAKNAQVQSDDVLFDDSITLVEHAPIGDFVDAMSEIDRLNESLWICADNNFKAPENHPDLAPISLAGQIHNLLRSLENDPHVVKEGEVFRVLLHDSITLASQIETQIGSEDFESALISLNAMTDSCVECHERYRD